VVQHREIEQESREVLRLEVLLLLLPVLEGTQLLALAGNHLLRHEAIELAGDEELEDQDWRLWSKLGDQID
jgi:hypothetical protein